MPTATARAHPNIAFIKYWGNHDDTLRLPSNSSISMNLAGLHTETTVTWDSNLPTDTLQLNGEAAAEPARQRVADHLEYIRERLSLTDYASVVSQNNFPTGTGIASSASAFAALTVAAVAAAGADLTERELSTIARLGSGSASRSIPTGFVEWYTADTHEASYAESFAAPDHWDLVDLIVVVSDQHKRTTSSAGHTTAQTSILQAARVADAQNRFDTVRRAILERDFATFADVVELDSNLMHAVMMTGNPSLFYWLPPTLAIMETIRTLRADGVQVCYTLDAGPNVHCICVREDANTVREALQTLSGIIEIREATPGGPAHVIPE